MKSNSLLAAKTLEAIWTEEDVFVRFDRPEMDEGEKAELADFAADSSNDFCTRAWITSLLLKSSWRSEENDSALVNQDLRHIAENSFYYILLGNEESIPVLAEAMETYPTPEIVGLYLNTGPAYLNDAAKSVAGRGRYFATGVSIKEKHSCLGIHWKGAAED